MRFTQMITRLLTGSNSKVLSKNDLTTKVVDEKLSELQKLKQQLDQSIDCKKEGKKVFAPELNNEVGGAEMEQVLTSLYDESGRDLKASQGKNIYNSNKFKISDQPAVVQDLVPVVDEANVTDAPIATVLTTGAKAMLAAATKLEAAEHITVQPTATPTTNTSQVILNSTTTPTTVPNTTIHNLDNSFAISSNHTAKPKNEEESFAQLLASNPESLVPEASKAVPASTTAGQLPAVVAVTSSATSPLAQHATIMTSSSQHHIPVVTKQKSSETSTEKQTVTRVANPKKRQVTAYVYEATQKRTIVQVTKADGSVQETEVNTTINRVSHTNTIASGDLETTTTEQVHRQVATKQGQLATSSTSLLGSGQKTKKQRKFLTATPPQALAHSKASKSTAITAPSVSNVVDVPIAVTTAGSKTAPSTTSTSKVATNHPTKAPINEFASMFETSDFSASRNVAMHRDEVNYQSNGRVDLERLVKAKLGKQGQLAGIEGPSFSELFEKGIGTPTDYLSSPAQVLSTKQAEQEKIQAQHKKQRAKKRSKMLLPSGGKKSTALTKTQVHLGSKQQQPRQFDIEEHLINDDQDRENYIGPDPTITFEQEYQKQLERDALRTVSGQAKYIDKDDFDWLDKLGQVQPLSKSSASPVKNVTKKALGAVSLAQQALRAKHQQRIQAALPSKKELLMQQLAQEDFQNNHFKVGEFISDINMTFTEDNYKEARFVRPGLDPHVAELFKRGDLDIHLIVDLHRMTREEAKEVIKMAINSAKKNHESIVHFITGHGKQILKQAVPNWLIQHSFVMAFKPSRDSSDTNGFIVLLKNYDKNYDNF